MFLLTALAACDEDSGRAGIAMAPDDGPKADNANSGGSEGGELNADMLEVLDEVSVLLGDPADHTADDDDSDGDSDAPDPKLTCAGRCGQRADLEVLCDCDLDCMLDDQCCSDFEAVCEEYFDDDWPARTDSCTDNCGGESQDGSCYCDPVCKENEDCCEDYEAVCASAPPEEPEPGYSMAPDPTATAGVCLKFIDDLDSIRTMIEVGGIVSTEAQSGQCIAAAMVVWKQSTGTTSPASVIACLGETSNDNTLVAAKSYLREKRSDLEECTDYTTAEVLELIKEEPWHVRARSVK